MKRLFIQTREFEKQLKHFDDAHELLREVEQEVLRDLQKPTTKRDTISGTGGFTKVRVGLPGLGKSSSARVIYFDANIAEVVFLFMIYSKAKVGNISDEMKSFLKMMASEFKEWKCPKKKE